MLGTKCRVEVLLKEYQVRHDSMSAATTVQPSTVVSFLKESISASSLQFGSDY